MNWHKKQRCGNSIEFLTIVNTKKKKAHWYSLEQGQNNKNGTELMAMTKKSEKLKVRL